MTEFFKQSAHVITRREGDSTLVFDQSTGWICIMNPTSEFIWERCNGQCSPEQIAQGLKHDFDAPEFCQDNEGLVEVVRQHLDLMHKGKLIDQVEASKTVPTAALAGA